MLLNPFRTHQGQTFLMQGKKINPKTKSYSGEGEGKEVVPLISMTTLPLTPAAAMGWVFASAGPSRAGNVSTSFCTFLLVGEGLSDQTTEVGWVRAMRIWVLERGHLLLGRVEWDRMGSCMEKGAGWYQSFNTWTYSSIPSPVVTTPLANRTPRLCGLLGWPGGYWRLCCPWL